MRSQTLVEHSVRGRASRSYLQSGGVYNLPYEHHAQKCKKARGILNMINQLPLSGINEMVRITLFTQTILAASA